MTYFEIMRNAIKAGKISRSQALDWLCLHGVRINIAYKVVTDDT